MSVPSEKFKELLSRFATGVTIVTFKDSEGPHGLTVNAFCSVSLEPQLILICIDKLARGHDILVERDAFVVNILSEDQETLCIKFATSGLDSGERFAGTGFHLNKREIPVFENTLAYLECKIVQELQGGDHTIFIGEVERGDVDSDKRPLLYYNSTFYKS